MDPIQYIQYILICVASLIALIAHVIISLEFGRIAKEKGFDRSKYFIYTLLFGIAGVLMVFALPDRGNRNSQE